LHRLFIILQGEKQAFISSKSTPCIPVEIDRHFGSNNSTLKMEATFSSETPVSLRTTRRYNPEGHRRVNFKSNNRNFRYWVLANTSCRMFRQDP
jgi:hypothetical protein